MERWAPEVFKTHSRKGEEEGRKNLERDCDTQKVKKIKPHELKNGNGLERTGQDDKGPSVWRGGDLSSGCRAL